MNHGRCGRKWRLLMLLRKDMSKIITKHHKNDEFSELRIKQIAERYAFLAGHGRLTLQRLAMTDNDNKKFVPFVRAIEKIQFMLAKEYITTNEFVNKFEFDRVFKILSKHKINAQKAYNVFPESGHFSMFMNNIHVITNNDYIVDNNYDYQRKAESYLFNYINNHSIDIILMDYILGGQHCITGIDLAKVINVNRNRGDNNKIPIVFLSKIELNDKSKSEAEEKYIYLFKWAAKGYFGYEHLEEDYFKKKVITEGIEYLLQENKKRKDKFSTKIPTE